MSVSGEAVLNRALGAYLGFAVGDALGAPVEFMTAGEIRQQYGELCEMRGGGWLRLAPGQVTDDTQMSIALGAAILQAQGWDLHCVAEHFGAWLKTRPIDVGNTCRRGITRFLREGTLESPLREADGGNGALMRNLPLVLYTLADDAMFSRLTLEQCHLTHHHPLSDAATLALGRITKVLLLGQGKHQAREIADSLVAMQRVFNFDPYPKRTSGYVVDTAQTVLHTFFSTDSFEACLIKTVNLGGDADTTGALAGMLAGAAYGLKAIPRRWLQALDRSVRATIEQQVTALLKLGNPQMLDS